jgi:hypothetical protein
MIVAVCCLTVPGCRGSEQRHEGPHALHGGSPIVRVPFERVPDNPRTSNDESNDQPLGHFGTMTLSVYYPSSGHRYPLDADVEDDTLLRLYFPKGGWVDFENCDLDDFEGECADENGREWVFEGKR